LPSSSATYSAAGVHRGAASSYWPDRDRPAFERERGR